MRVDLEGTRVVVDAALDAGVTLFDTGDIDDGTEARGSRAYIHKADDGSLQRLRTDVIDLYQYHTPDNVTPFEETFGALDELVRAGKVRYVGHSNLDAKQVEEVDAICHKHDF